MPLLHSWDSAAARQLVDRAALGGPPSLVAQMAAQSRDEAVDGLLEAARAAPLPPAPDWVRHPWVNTERVYPETSTAERRENHRRTGERQRAELQQLRAWWLGELIHSPAPLREVMTLFWHGHFTTATNKVFISQAIYEQHALLRRHALGNFRDLLRDITLDAAMMLYLDLEESDRLHPNENYARELLELFTLGEGNYTERDIREIARALTGWTLDAPPGSPAVVPAPADAPRAFRRDGLVARLNSDRHDGGEKEVLGRRGKLGVDEVVDILAAHPQTAKHIAGRLIAFFGVSDPEHALQERMARTFAREGGEMAPVVRELLIAPEFYSAASRGESIKSPVQLVVGACRQLELDVQPTPLLAQSLAAMGQELFCPPNVKGWPGGKAWISTGTLAVRYHLPETLLDSREPPGLAPIGRERFLPLPADPAARRQLLETLADLDRRRAGEQREDGIKSRLVVERLFPGAVPDDPGAVVDALLGRLLSVAPRPETRQILADACTAVPADQRPALAARLILMSPEYQLL